MRYLILCAFCFSFAACETVENPDGTVTTRFDAAAATSAINTGFDAWQRYDRQTRFVGYDQFGNPIYQ